MGQLLLIVVVAVTVAAVVFGVTVLVSGRDPGLSPAEPDGRALPLPTTRPLLESDLGEVRFDLATRGYRMAQVDQALRRAAYDIGYKDELIGVLEAEVNALREGRLLDADALRRAREAAQAPAAQAPVPAEAGKPGWTEFTRPADSGEIAVPPAAAGPAETVETEATQAEPVAAAPALDEPAPAEPADAVPTAPESTAPEPAESAAGEPAGTPEQAAKAAPAQAGPVAEPAESTGGGADQPAPDAGEPTEPAPVAPAKRATRRTPATRTARPAKRAAAAVADPVEAESPGVSPESAPTTKSAIESETSEAATPAEDAESARR